MRSVLMNALGWSHLPGQRPTNRRKALFRVISLTGRAHIFLLVAVRSQGNR